MNQNTIKIYYFTGTGNSLHIAQDLSNRLNGAQLISISMLMKINNPIVIEGEIIGFVFPVYFARPPVFIEEFINRVKIGNISYIFSVVNGGGLFGQVIKLFENLIIKKGKKLNAGFIIKMPGNHPKLASLQNKPDWYSKRKDKKMEKIVEAINERKEPKFESNFGLLGGYFSYWGFKKPYKLSKNRKLDDDIRVNSDCIKCGTCEKICPVGNIINSNISPQWQNQCINCSACYNFCEQKAIQIGNFTDDCRYHHPDISIEEIIQRR